MTRDTGFTGAGLLRMLAFGAVGGSLLDGIHTHSGMTSYAHPVFWLMAWWTPPLFAAACTSLGFGYVLMHRRAPAPGLRVWIGLLAFVACYFASGYLPASNPVKLVVLLAVAVGLWGATDRSLPTLVLAIVTAVVGPSIEVLLVHLGVFTHLRADFAGIPMWLPPLYVSAAVGGAPFIAWLGSRGGDADQRGLSS